MRIPRRPKQLTTTLRDHAELEDRPVFVYRFPTTSEEATRLFQSVDRVAGEPEVRARLEALDSWEERAAELQRAIEAGDVAPETPYGALLVEVFDTQLITIESLQIDDEPFDRGRHLEDVPTPWKIEVALEITARLRSYLTDAEEGNSSSPSSSAGGSTNQAEPSTAAARAGDAS